MATNINTILNWFKTGLKPTQAQFWATWASFWHKDEQIPQNSIFGLENTLNAKTDKVQFNAHKLAQDAHAPLFALKQSINEKGIAKGYAPLNEFVKIANQYLNIVDDLVTGGETALLSAEQGKVLKAQIDAINVILNSDNIDLDSIQKLADAIENIQMSLQTILVNDLTTGGITKALSAEQGKLLDLLKENKTNKTDDIETNKTSFDKYTSAKGVYDWVIGRFQTILVSGTNIKTINGNSLLGSGDIAILPSVSEDTNKTIALGPAFYSPNYGVGVGRLLNINSKGVTGIHFGINSVNTFLIETQGNDTRILAPIGYGLSIGAYSNTSQLVFNSNGTIKAPLTTNDLIDEDASGKLLTTKGWVQNKLNEKVGLNTIVKLKSHTVANLPTGTVGDIAYVTDALTPTYNSEVTGGGTEIVVVFFDGTSWKAH